MNSNPYVSAMFRVASGIDTLTVKLMRVGWEGHDMHDRSYELLICKLFGIYLVTQRQKGRGNVCEC